MDGTLYTHSGYADHQETSQTARLAAWLGISEEEGAARLADARRSRAASRLPQTSMANHFLEMGVDMDTIVRWRVEEIRPGEWLEPDTELARELAGLRAASPAGPGLRLALLTNNPASVGRASLKALGVEDLFETVTGLDVTGRSKPDPAPFLTACASLGLRPEECVSVGDRERIDILPALALGMGAVLVEGRDDIGALRALFGW